jgi:hypothetical protein
MVARLSAVECTASTVGDRSRSTASRPAAASLKPRVTLLFPPAVLLTTLVFATVLAVVKSWGRIRGGRTPGVQRR